MEREFCIRKINKLSQLVGDDSERERGRDDLQNEMIKKWIFSKKEKYIYKLISF